MATGIFAPTTPRQENEGALRIQQPHSLMCKHSPPPSLGPSGGGALLSIHSSFHRIPQKHNRKSVPQTVFPFLPTVEVSPLLVGASKRKTMQPICARLELLVCGHRLRLSLDSACGKRLPTMQKTA